MARMYSRRKGKSGSKKPVKKTKPTWLRYSAKECEMLIAKMGKEGMSASQIGLHLRDTYGIPNVKIITGKQITQILKEKKLMHELPEDLRALIKRAIILKKHTEANPHDMTALRGFQLTESKIKRLVRYYKQTGVLPLDWKYDPTKVKLAV